MKTNIDEIGHEVTENSESQPNWGWTKRVWIVQEIRSDRGHLAIEVQGESDVVSNKVAAKIAVAAFDQLMEEGQ